MASGPFTYCVATNTGKGFFTAHDRRNFFLRGYPANVWVVGNNEKGAMWVAERGNEKTKSEAQALVDTEIAANQAAYDALSAEEQARSNRPGALNLP